MKTVTLDVRTPREVSAEFVRVWKSRKADSNARISFATPELLWKVLTAKPWELIKAMAGQGPMTLRETARRAGRDARGCTGTSMRCWWQEYCARTPAAKSNFRLTRYTWTSCSRQRSLEKHGKRSKIERGVDDAQSGNARLCRCRYSGTRALVA